MLGVFKQFIGQQHWQDFFSLRAASLGAAAFAIIGPTHIGKKTFVMLLSQILLCQRHTVCGSCDSCRAWSQEKYHADLVMLQTKEGETKIGVEQAREFIVSLAATPIYGPYKIGFLVDAEQLTVEAQQVLLKTLEEPPDHVILFATLANERVLLPTVISRLARINFAPVREAELIKKLQGCGVTNEQAKELASLSSGRPGLALSWLKNITTFIQYKKEEEQLLKIIQGRLAGAFAFTETVATQSDISSSELSLLLRHWQLIIRKQLLRSGTKSMASVGLDSVDYWFTLLVAIETVITKLGRNANRRLVLNEFFIIAHNFSRPNI